jgi:hypothetical protein
MLIMPCTGYRVKISAMAKTTSQEMRGENYGTFLMSPQIQVEVVNHTKPKTHVKTKTGKSHLKQQ